MHARTALIEQLNDFSPATRTATLATLAKSVEAPPATAGNVNMHCHSFFSYNAEGWSPSRIAWEARSRGLYAAALTDFDLLDGLEEMFQAGETLSLRTAVHLETRAYLADYASVDINSPGEPGATYIMGTGFSEVPREGTPQAQTLASYRQAAQERNVALIKRINAALSEIALDYEADVLPLTPRQVATERHIMSAYATKAEEKIPDAAKRAKFWADVMAMGVEDAEQLLKDRVKLEDKVRAALAKRGGIGYVAPSPEGFPAAEDFINWVLACGALPTVTWLDGTSEGESNAKAMLENLVGKGCAALNIVPDRNWNHPDPEKKTILVENLRTMVREANAMHLPINIGTEMNKKGLPFVDDLGGEVLSEFKDAFRHGANIMVGHTTLSRFANFGYLSEAACAAYPDRASRNGFFAAVGALPPVTTAGAEKLKAVGPEQALSTLREAVASTFVSR